MVHTGMTKRPKPKNKTCCRYWKMDGEYVICQKDGSRHVDCKWGCKHWRAKRSAMIFRRWRT